MSSSSNNTWSNIFPHQEEESESIVINVRDHRLASKKYNPLAAVKASNLPPRNDEENKTAQETVKNWTLDWALALALAEKEKVEQDKKNKRDPEIKLSKARARQNDEENELSQDEEKVETKALNLEDKSQEWISACSKRNKIE